MKSLKKKFGKFAVSHEKAVKISGGNEFGCNCDQVNCLAPEVGLYTADSCQILCCEVSMPPIHNWFL